MIKFRVTRKTYLANVKNSTYVVHFFSGTIYNRWLKFRKGNHESLDYDLTQGFFIHGAIKKYDLFMGGSPGNLSEEPVT